MELSDQEKFDLYGDEYKYDSQTLDKYADNTIAIAKSLSTDKERIEYYHDKIGNINNEFDFFLSEDGFNQIRQRFDNEIQRIKNSLIHTVNKKKQKKIYGFATSLTPTNIESLYNELKYKYIDCSLDEWKVLFDDKKEVKAGSIKWRQSRETSSRLLAYLIQTVFYSSTNNEIKIQWEEFAKIFDTRNLKGELAKNPHPKGADHIDSIVKKYKNK